jgi:steroid delta-isomerase
MRDHTTDLDAYAAAFEALTPQNLASDLGPFYAEQAYFEDPFNQV